MVPMKKKKVYNEKSGIILAIDHKGVKSHSMWETKVKINGGKELNPWCDEWWKWIILTIGDFFNHKEDAISLYK